MSSIQSVVILVEICVAHQSSVVSVFLQNFSLSLCIIVQTDTPPIARLMVPASKTPPRSWHHNGTVQRPCPPAACAPSTCCTWAPLRASPDIRRRPGGCDDARAGGPRCAPAAVHVADRRGAETAGQQQVSRLLRLFPPPSPRPPHPLKPCLLCDLPLRSCPCHPPHTARRASGSHSVFMTSIATPSAVTPVRTI